jgi:hypothetical protein
MGWGMLRPFPEEKEYNSKVVFPVFQAGCRIANEEILKLFCLNMVLKNTINMSC